MATDGPELAAHRNRQLFIVHFEKSLKQNCPNLTEFRGPNPRLNFQ